MIDNLFLLAKNESDLYDSNLARLHIDIPNGNLPSISFRINLSELKALIQYPISNHSQLGLTIDYKITFLAIGA